MLPRLRLCHLLRVLAPTTSAAAQGFTRKCPRRGARSRSAPCCTVISNGGVCAATIADTSVLRLVVGPPDGGAEALVVHAPGPGNRQTNASSHCRHTSHTLQTTVIIITRNKRFVPKQNHIPPRAHCGFFVSPFFSGSSMCATTRRAVRSARARDASAESPLTST